MANAKTLRQEKNWPGKRMIPDEKDPFRLTPRIQGLVKQVRSSQGTRDMKQHSFCKDYLNTLPECTIQGQEWGGVPESSSNASGERSCSLTKEGNRQEKKGQFYFVEEEQPSCRWVRCKQAVQESGIKDTMRFGIWTTEWTVVSFVETGKVTGVGCPLFRDKKLFWTFQFRCILDIHVAILIPTSSSGNSQPGEMSLWVICTQMVCKARGPVTTQAGRTRERAGLSPCMFQCLGGEEALVNEQY